MCVCKRKYRKKYSPYQIYTFIFFMLPSMHVSKHIDQNQGDKLITTSYTRKSCIVRFLFVKNSVKDRKNRNRRNHQAQQFRTTFENLTNGARRRRVKRRRKKYRGKAREEK